MSKVPKLMVSSSVYGHEGLLDQVFGVLAGYGFDVWMSHKGTIPVLFQATAFESCLRAVQDCDFFLGIITSRYGSGKDGEEQSITHLEIKRAVELGKPRVFLVHRDVVVARQLLRQFRYEKDGTKRDRSFFKPTAVIDDIRVIDMYEDAIREGLPLAERTGNWAQTYDSPESLLLFLRSQFSNPEELAERISAPPATTV